jgi:hypothetical protein
MTAYTPPQGGTAADLLRAVQDFNDRHPAFLAKLYAQMDEDRALFAQMQRQDVLTQAAMGDLR